MRMQAAFDLAKFRQGLQAEADQITRMARRAQTELAWRAREDVKTDMWTRAFDRPTPWVTNGMMIRPAEGEGQPAELDWKPGSAGSIPASRIVHAQIEGGARRAKRFEVALRRIGALAQDQFAVWGSGAPLDRYGNLTGARIVKILSDLQAFQEVGFQANRRADRKSRGKLRDLKYFYVRGTHPGLNLPAGIYEQRRRGNPKLIIAFVKRASYRPRFAPARIARESIARNTAEVWRLAITKTLPFRSLRG